MTLGDFVFDFPVWIIRADIRGKHSFACCEVEGQDCLAVFTDKPLIEQYLEQHPVPGTATAVQLDTAAALAGELEDALVTDLATHIIFDPVPKGFVWPIAKAIPELLRNNE